MMQTKNWTKQGMTQKGLAKKMGKTEAEVSVWPID